MSCENWRQCLALVACMQKQCATIFGFLCCTLLTLESFSEGCTGYSLHFARFGSSLQRKVDRRLGQHEWTTRPSGLWRG